MSEPLVEASGLTKYFTAGEPSMLTRLRGEQSYVKAVDGIDVDIWPGETLGLVGESGCGKSTAGEMLARLLEPTDGSVYYDGRSASEIPEKEYHRDVQLIFQDPMSSLNRRKTIGQIVKRPLVVHGLAGGRRKERVGELLEMVGLSGEQYGRYPHELSGGQRQRVGIARALAVEPEFIICDEPVSALDVSVQAQILNLLADLQEDLDLTYLFISHDLSVVRYITDRVAVMYLGEIMEVAETLELFEDPKHPYTQALLGAIPDPDPESEEERSVLEGTVPSAIDPPSGCPFHTRCPKYIGPICEESDPDFRSCENGTEVRCHLYE